MSAVKPSVSTIVAAVDRVGLAVVHEPERDALIGQPAQGLSRVADQQFGEFGVGPALGEPAHVLAEVVGTVRLDVVRLYPPGACTRRPI
jgi:hypothetical protein